MEENSVSGDPEAVQIVGEVANDDAAVRAYGSDAAARTTDTQIDGEVTKDDEEDRENGSDTAVETTVAQAIGGEQRDVRTTLAGGMTVAFMGVRSGVYKKLVSAQPFLTVL